MCYIIFASHELIYVICVLDSHLTVYRVHCTIRCVLFPFFASSSSSSVFMRNVKHYAYGFPFVLQVKEFVMNEKKKKEMP